MKRIALIIALLCLFLPALALALPEENVENIKVKNIEKAGRTELEKAEKYLAKLKNIIENNVDTMPSKEPVGIITYKKVYKLNFWLTLFENEKEREDARLDFYKLKTSTAIPEEIKNLTEVYFSTISLHFGDNAAQEIKKYFVEKTGEDVVVEKKIKTVGVIISIFFIISALILFGGIFLKFK